VAGTSQLDYEQRVSRVIDHVRTHLAEELSRATLARVAAFSPFHFHRVFRAVTGETLFGFIQRPRLEKAAGALHQHPGLSALAIALDHGFMSAATFARAFRPRFGMTATPWRTGGAERWRARQARERKPGKPLRKSGKHGAPDGRILPAMAAGRSRWVFRSAICPRFTSPTCATSGPTALTASPRCGGGYERGWSPAVCVHGIAPGAATPDRFRSDLCLPVRPL